MVRRFPKNGIFFVSLGYIAVTRGSLSRSYSSVSRHFFVVVVLQRLLLL